MIRRKRKWKRVTVDKHSPKNIEDTLVRYCEKNRLRILERYWTGNSHPHSWRRAWAYRERDGKEVRLYCGVKLIKKTLRLAPCWKYA